MTSRRKSDRRGLRSLWIGLLILGAIHIPLPQADYHNVRHHDAPGEICPYHDHLLRWHPWAAENQDVSLLHWHWFVPLVEPGARQLGDDEHRPPGSGPALHAHVGDWPEPDWTGTPMIRPDHFGRMHGRLASHLPGEWSTPCLYSLDSLSPQFFCSCPTNGLVALRAERASLFQRWNC